MTKPIYFIVILVYNSANYLREAIERALAQISPYLEVIVVNNGSTDDGKIETIAKSYGGYIRYFFKENSGVSSALNLGIRQMTGEWLAWFSQDDLFAPIRAETALTIYAKRWPARAKLIATPVLKPCFKGFLR